MALKPQTRINTNVYFVRERDLQTLLAIGQTTVNLAQNARAMSEKAFLGATGLQKKSQSFTHQDWGECYVWLGADFDKLPNRENFPINEIEIISQDFSEIVENFNATLDEKDAQLSEKDAEIEALRKQIASMSAPKKRGGTTSLLDTTPTTEQ